MISQIYAQKENNVLGKFILLQYCKYVMKRLQNIFSWYVDQFLLSVIILQIIRYTLT